MKKEKLKILYEDKYIIVVYKKPGLLTISTDKEKDKTLFHEVREYEKKKNKNNKVFIVHRLDKDTEGLVVFAKDMKTKNVMQNNWDKVIRKYVALVHGHVKNKKAILFAAFLTIEIKTGRKHQIRVQLAHIKHYIVGDKKYSKKKDGFRNLCLCANYLKFKHPITHKDIEISTSYPSKYEEVIKKSI